MPLDQLQKALANRFEVPPERTAGWAYQMPGVRLRHGQVSLETGPAGTAPKIRLPVGKGLFRISDRKAAVVTLVTGKMLAGSEASVTKTVSRVMGLLTDRRYYFTLPDRTTINLSHYEKSPIPALGGLRQPLQALGARKGDIASIFLDLETETAELQVSSQDEITTGWQTVVRLTGINAAAAREGLADAMMCRTEEIERMLRLRKDWPVLKALPGHPDRGEEQKAGQPGRAATWSNAAGRCAATSSPC